MADWPRAIQPEDRIKYLVNARAEFGEEVTWSKEDGGIRAATPREEYLWTDRVESGHEAWFTTEHQEPHLVGEFQTLYEAKRALVDHVVVRWAVAQAWGDVAG